MSSHYARVAKLVEFAERFDWLGLEKLIEETDPEDLADDIGFVIEQLFKAIPTSRRKKVVQHLLQSVTNYEFERIVK